jgi:ABC-type polysaccharide/polyol phosphate transport system ATPase subunit
MIVFVTLCTGAVRGLCDRVILLEGGSIATEGGADEVAQKCLDKVILAAKAAGA